MDGIFFWPSTSGKHESRQKSRQAIGKVTKQVVGTDWELYTEQLGFYFPVNGIAEAKTKAVLWTNLSAENYQLAKNLVTPMQLKDDAITYTVIEERMQKQLKPERSATLDDRWRFSGKQPQILLIPFVVYLHCPVSTVNFFADKLLPYCD